VGQGDAFDLVLVEIFFQRVAMFILCSFGTGGLELATRWPDAPDALPVFQADVVGARPFTRRLLVASFIKMFFNASFFHV
jgi:hypothetical protein